MQKVSDVIDSVVVESTNGSTFSHQLYTHVGEHAGDDFLQTVMILNVVTIATLMHVPMIIM